MRNPFRRRKDEWISLYFDGGPLDRVSIMGPLRDDKRIHTYQFIPPFAGGTYYRKRGETHWTYYGDHEA